MLCSLIKHDRIAGHMLKYLRSFFNNSELTYLHACFVLAFLPIKVSTILGLIPNNGIVFHLRSTKTALRLLNDHIKTYVYLDIAL